MSSRSIPPPPSLERLLAGSPPADATDPLLVGRLLEEGEEADLRWLVAAAGEHELAGWLERRGGRQLSRRSRAFWRLVLGVEPAPGSEIAEELWSA